MAIPRPRQLAIANMLLITVLCLGLLVPTQTAAAETATLIQTINTGAGGTWGPKYSPDPAGITYWPAKNNLVIVDSEVDEMPIWDGANIFESSLNGVRGTTYDFTNYSKETAGIDIDVAPNGHFWISDDGQQRVFDINLGGDNKFGTSDDSVRIISVAFNSDPEGLTLVTLNGEMQLFMVDGKNKKLWRCQFGPNGVFDGGGDDIITSKDLQALGINDPEGLDYDVSRGTFWIIDHTGNRLNEVTTSATFVQSFNLNTLANAVAPADVTVAPGSQGGTSLYIVDRGVDNNDVPTENDGKIYEVRIGAVATQVTVTQRTPAPNATGVDVATNVTATFSKDVNGAKTGFTLTGPNAQLVPATVAYDSATRTATLDPDSDLQPSTTYTAKLDSTISDLDGNALAETTWSFTTAASPVKNLLENPGFEDDTNNDGKPDIWSINKKFTRSNTTAHGGTYAGKFFTTSDASATIQQTVPNLSAGTTYNIAGWVNIPTTSDAFSFKIKVQWLNASGAKIKSVTAITIANDTGGVWLQASKNLVAPAGTVSALVLINPSSLNGTIYVDDFELK